MTTTNGEIGQGRFLESDWLSPAQLDQLESTLGSLQVKEMLRNFMGIQYSDPKKVVILSDWHFYNYAYCKERAFSSRQTCCFMSMMHHVFVSDVGNAASTAQSSHEAFESILLKHAVERPPVSIKVFNQDQVSSIMDYVTNSYYRHFLLYKYIFGTRVIRSLKQVLPQEVEYATPRLQALDTGLFLPKD